MKKIIFTIGLLSLLLVSAGSVQAAGEKNMLIVLDASGSMLEQFGTVNRMDAAKSTISDLMVSLDPSVLVGFRPYAHVKKTTQTEACQVSELVQTFTGDRNAITSKVSQIQAVGSYTPTAYALSQVQKDFVVGNDNMVILLTDGKETCGGDPAKAARDLLAAGIKVKTYVIGLGVDSATRTELSGIAQAGGGLYFDATDSASLAASLKTIQQKEQPIDKTNTDARLGTAVRGGNGFDTAVTIVPGTYRLDHHQKKDEYDYFKLAVVKDVPVTIKMVTGAKGVKFDSKTNSFIEDNSAEAGFRIFDTDRVKILNRWVSESFSKAEGTYKPKESSFVYIAIGEPDYNMHKDTVFTISVETPEAPVPTPVADIQQGNTEGDISSFDTSSDDKKVSPEAAFKDLSEATGGLKKILYYVIGAAALIIFIIAVVVALLIKRYVKKSHAGAANTVSTAAANPVTPNTQTPPVSAQSVSATPSSQQQTPPANL